MIRLFTGVVILLVTFIYAFIVGILVVSPTYKSKVTDIKLIKSSYVKEIKADFINHELAKKHLDKFNEYGHNHIVKFKAEDVEGEPRPITIEIRKLGEDFYEQLNDNKILAYALSQERSCKIVIKDDLVTEDQFRDTLIHEFLHCYEYDHVPLIESDLMYYEDNRLDKLPSIIRYAEEVEKRIQ